MTIPCPFVSSKGKPCKGHIVRIEAFKADLCWSLDEGDGRWHFSHGEPRSHYHLYCSEKGNHSGHARPDNEQMKRFASDLSPKVLSVIDGK